MLVKLAFLPLVTAGIGLARGLSTPEYAGTTNEMSYGKATKIGAGIGAGIGALGVGAMGALSAVAASHGRHPGAALGGLIGGGLLGAASGAIGGGLSGAAGVLGTRLGRSIKGGEYKSKHEVKKHKK